MPSVPVPADPGRDGDPAWLDRDPMTAAEREAWLDRLCAQDDDPSSRDGPPGGYGTWRLHTPGDGPDLLVTLDPLTTQDCDHQFESRGHDPGVKLKHLSQIRHATCTSPVCRRPARRCDFEHNTPYEAGGRTCLCNAGPKCRHDHRLKQHPKWKVDQLPDGTFRWTTPAGRTYTTEPTRYPI